MNRLMIFACILLLLCGATGCCKKGSNRLDIALEGPWILYEDSQFDDHGKKVPALIAIAPIGATVESLKPDDYAHHHSPQLSTGDGFYIQKPFLKKAHIFCLTFDGKCAPEGPESLSSDSYPPSRLLKLTRISGSGAWDWVTASKMQAVLILPMPDSFSNDGTWNMRFGPKGDETHSIGLHLHYANGPEKFSLQF